MAVFATRAIRAGDELTHSYLPLAVLVRSAPRRQPHLHFACRCARCQAEAAGGAAGGAQGDADGEGGCRRAGGGAVEGDTMQLPPAAAKECLAFHLSCAAGESAHAL